MSVAVWMAYWSRVGALPGEGHSSVSVGLNVWCRRSKATLDARSKAMLVCCLRRCCHFPRQRRLSAPLCASLPPQPRLHPPRLLRPSPQLRPGSLRNHALRDGEPARQARCVGSLASRPTQGRGQHSSAPPAPSPARRLAAYRVGGKDRPPLSPLHTRVRFPHGAVTRDRARMNGASSVRSMRMLMMAMERE